MDERIDHDCSVRISVIIPTLGEVNYLEKTVRSVRTAGNLLCEIIVADCGSKDGTVALARGLGCRVVAAEAGAKWRPLNAGARAAQGDVFLFLDADTSLPVGYDTAIAGVLANRAVVGGAFEFALLERGAALRFIEFVNRVRYRIWQRYYGDQAIFVRREAFENVGGFPQLPLMEASRFCEALKRAGGLRLIRKRACTSARRFLEGGVWRVFLSDCRFWFLDTIRFPTKRHGAAYWEENLRRDERTEQRP